MTNQNDLVVVTGASSFVGAHLAVFLRQHGYRVLAALTQQPGDYVGLRAERVQMMAMADVGFARLDLLDPDLLVKEIRRLRPAYWISHAGWTKDYTNNHYDLDHAHMLHVSPYEMIFQALKEVACKGLIHTGTSAEYGSEVPMFDENSPCWPDSPYGLSKLTKTLYLKQLAQRHGLPVRVVRLFLPYGPLDSPAKFVSSVMDRLSRDEPIEIQQVGQRRDFLHIDDVCRGYLAVLGDVERASLYEIFNICAGEAVPLKSLAIRLAVLLGKDPALVVDGTGNPERHEGSVHFGSNAKARNLLGWVPRSLEESLAHFVAAFRSGRPTSTPVLALPTSQVRLSRSSVNIAAIRRVAATLRKGYLGMGLEVEHFEQELQRFVGGEKREVMAVSTGTAALQLALHACGIGSGDEVLVPTITYLASYQAISATGATPVSCEVRAGDCLLDLADAERRITPRTRAVMPVHYASNPALLGEVYDFARRHGLRVIEDAAHAFGCTWQGQRVGATGDLVCFSFDGIKNITAGEGGAVVTGDQHAAEFVRNARLLGVEKDTEQRYKGERSWAFDVTHQGWRYHMSNINATLGRAQLEVLQSTMAPVRVHMATRYQELLAGLSSLRMLPIRYGEIVPHIFPVFIDATLRDEVQSALKKYNIESGMHYQPNHLLTYFGGGKQSFPVAEQLHREMLTLPLHAELRIEEQDRVVKIIKQILAPQTHAD